MRDGAAGGVGRPRGNGSGGAANGHARRGVARPLFGGDGASAEAAAEEAAPDENAPARGGGGGGAGGGRLRPSAVSGKGSSWRSLAFRKSNVEAGVSIELVEYDRNLRTAYEQRQQRIKMAQDRLRAITGPSGPWREAETEQIGDVQLKSIPQLWCQATELQEAAVESMQQ